MVLLAVLCASAGEDAYGVNVHAELERRTGAWRAPST
jgi:hypothetical protein